MCWRRRATLSVWWWWIPLIPGPPWSASPPRARSPGKQHKTFSFALCVFASQDILFCFVILHPKLSLLTLVFAVPALTLTFGRRFRPVRPGESNWGKKKVSSTWLFVKTSVWQSAASDLRSAHVAESLLLSGRKHGSVLSIRFAF